MGAGDEHLHRLVLVIAPPSSIIASRTVDNDRLLSSPRSSSSMLRLQDAVYGGAERVEDDGGLTGCQKLRVETDGALTLR